MAIKYTVPKKWLRYEIRDLVDVLTDAKAAVLSLVSVPYQRSWAESLQQIQLKHEVAGTSRIEGADFTEKELDAALQDETPEEMLTRSQRQARAAVQTYKWISRLPDEKPIDENLIKEVHRRIVTGCDDDHCQPAELREDGYNVTFGRPLHRGAEGGKECHTAFQDLCRAMQEEFRGHDILIRALALHYHLGAMHPFQDGNGRTARAVEALIFQRAGLRDTLFIALSNYYYDEKASYLSALNQSRSQNHDLTPFLIFGLKGIAFQCHRLLSEINNEISKVLFRDIMNDLFSRLRSAKKRAMSKRHITVLNCLLENKTMEISDLYDAVRIAYLKLKDPWKAFVRDLIYIRNLNAIEIGRKNEDKVIVSIRMKWPMEITETEFFEKVNRMPKAKTYDFLQKSKTGISRKAPSFFD